MKCATNEGWADFVAAATTWKPNASSAWAFGEAWNLEGETSAGSWPTKPRQCVRDQVYVYPLGYFSSPPGRHEGNVARYFWDLYDSTTVDDSASGYSDNQTTAFRYILGAWDLFPSGTANHAANESGDDGRNVYDYAYRFDQQYSGSAEGEMYVNCLENQATD